MPGGQPIRLGPFIGGLNTASDPTAIADAELSVGLNMELDIDGSLISRPPFKELEGDVSFTERIIILCEATFNDLHYLIGSNVNGVYYRLAGSWVLITNTFRAAAALQYDDHVYLIPHPSVTPGLGGKWEPGGGFTVVAPLPNGQAAIVHKERLFVAPGIESSADSSRLKFSNAGNFDVFDVSDFVDVGQGDGTKLIDLTVFQDNLILFKSLSTYVLAYDIRPSDAVLRKISLTIGVDQQFCMVNYENQVYVLSNGWVYEILNYDFHRINTKVPFVRDGTAPSDFSTEDIFLGILEDRLVCRFFRKVYVYGMRTRTWSEWESESDVLHYFGPITTMHMTTGNEYYAGSCLQDNRTLLQFFDSATATTREQTLDAAASITDTFSVASVASWSNTNTGETWTNAGGSASDFSKAGGKGLHSNATVGVNRTSTISGTYQNFDERVSVTVPVVALTASIFMAVRARVVDASNFYTYRCEFGLAGVLTININKTVAGVQTVLATAVFGGGYSAGETFNIRCYGSGPSLKLKVWRPVDLEPLTWNHQVTDATFPLAGQLYLLSVLGGGNTNTLPVVTSWDDFSIARTADVVHTITCRTKTKNFDMAISHQFKRLWWWGADVSSNNAILGRATPIVVAFRATWANLATKKWSQLNTWAQPLTEPSTVETTTTTGTGTARRFAKFLKSLRYRQINFEVVLTTNGSTVDGPARLFSMTILTESKEIVVGSVS